MPILVSPTVGADGAGTPGSVIHDGQLLLGDITLGAVDDYGVSWVLESLTGWSDVPASTGTTDQRAGDHGGIYGPAYYAPRTVEINGSLEANTWDAATRALGRLMAAIPLDTPALMTVAENEQVLQTFVRQEGDPLTDRAFNWAHFSLSLTAADPRRYSVDLTTASTGLPRTTGGLSLPISLPVSIGATTSSGLLSVTNDGNMPTRPTLTVTGPCPAFAITHRQSGRTLRFADSIGAGRSLVIDTDRKRALLDGTAVRVVTGSWFEYAPGVNDVAFTAATYDSGALLTSTSRSAWR